MKKIMIFATAVAALAACSKEAETVVDANHFEKGQKVTLTVKAGEPSTKVSSELNGTAVDFKWEAKDSIKVTVNGQPAKFTLASGAGDAEATFTGTMPAGGSTFSVQYPYEVPYLDSQTYSSTEALPHDKMLFIAGDCQLSDKAFELAANNAALRLKLWGTNQTISKIVVNNKNTIGTYTLTIAPAVTLPSTEAAAQAFYIVVPAGTTNFSAEVYDAADTPAKICEFTTTEAQTFTANKILDMPAKKVEKTGKIYPGTELEGIKIGDVVWAPVNCGYDATNAPTGLFYQWGRKYGQSNTKSMKEADFITTQASSMADGNVEANKDKFYVGNHNWFPGNTSDTWSSEYNPCPAGWRVPTVSEFSSLASSSSFVTGKDITGKGSGSYSGRLFPSSGDTQVFFPIAGFRGNSSGSVLSTALGYYWSSLPQSGEWAYDFLLNASSVNTSTTYRANGCSVRCVQE